MSRLDSSGSGNSVSTRVLSSVVRRLLDARAAPRLAERIGSWPQPALLESGQGFGIAGRHQILTAHPRLIFEANGPRWRITTDQGSAQSGDGDPLAALGELTRRYELAQSGSIPAPNEPPFQGGLIGYLGYDATPLIEPIPRRLPLETRLPDIRFGLYDTAVIVDGSRDTTELWAWDLLGEGDQAVRRRAHRWQQALEHRPARPIPRSRFLSPLTPLIDRSAYLRGVDRILEYIAAGDVYQVNLSRRFEARGRVSPLDLYLRLKRQSPAPFAAFLAWDDLALVSASPEWFYQTRGDRIVTRPIKGTRPRGPNTSDDLRLAAELQASPKDRAELTMIVDLERNDLGRVCDYGTIHVSEPATVESFPQVHHLVATVEGRLRESLGPIDVIQAMFPGGSITGAPKIRAMQIIDELEPCRRGVYTGSIGYLSRGGSSAFNIAIRTIVVEGDRAHFHVGGGIVADSSPELEHLETLAKGRALRAVIDPAAGEWIDP